MGKNQQRSFSHAIWPSSSVWFRRAWSSGAIMLFLPMVSLTAAEQDWFFDVNPYLWVADIGLETTRRLSPAPATDRYETTISAGAMLAAQVRYQAVGLFVDFAWIRLSTEALNPGPAFSAASLRSDVIHSTAAVTCQLPLSGKFHAETLAGARLWSVSEDLVFADGVLPGFEASKEKKWADPVIGASFSYDLSKSWSADVKGIVGGFGVSADFAAEVYAGVSYRMTDRWSLSAGYRYVLETYSRDAFAFNLDASGLLLGVGFHF